MIDLIPTLLCSASHRGEEFHAREGRRNLSSISSVPRAHKIQPLLTRYLPRNGAPDFCLSVFEELHECRHKVSVDYLLINGFRDLDRISLRLLRWSVHQPFQTCPQPYIGLSSSCPRTSFARQSARLRDSIVALWVQLRQSR